MMSEIFIMLSFMTQVLLLSASAGACVTRKTPEPEPVVPTPTSFDAASDRLLALSDNGWVVSRDADGIAQHKGDSLIFTGIAMGVLDCVRGRAPEMALMRMFDDTDGGFYRHPDIPNEWTLDGAIGVYWGAYQRSKRCPSSQSLWGTALLRNKAKIKLDPYFDVMRDSVLATLGIGAVPDPDLRGRLGTEITGWAIGTVSWKKPAYRLHLGFLALDVIDAPKGKVAFCEAVIKAKMPLLDDFCDRPGLSRWIDDFEFNRWEYAHQRSPEWETPDGNGLETPGLDYLMALYRRDQ